MRKLKWVALILIGSLLLSGASVALAEPPSAEHPYGWYPGVTLTVAVLSGVHHIPWAEADKRFEQMTGVKIEVVEFPFSAIYDKLMIEGVSHSGAFDIMELCNMWVPEFKVGGFILPLDDYVKKWDPNLEDIAEPVKKLMRFGGRYWSILLDGDVFLLHYRKDLFENETYKSAFKAHYGYELAPPESWKQYRDIAEFFTRDTDGDGRIDLWGNTLMLIRVHLPFTFVQMLKSYGVDYFDPETMEPQISSPRAVEALKMLKELVKSMPPGNLNWGYTEVREAFIRGEVALMVNWNEITYEVYEGTQVANKTGYTLVPGTFINNKLHRASLQAWGWTGVISADSRNPEATYQFLRYVTSPEIMATVFHRGDPKVGSLGYEPWRESEFTHPSLMNFTPASPQWLKAIQKSMAHGVSDLCIPGGFSYYDALAVEVGEALAGKKTAEEALNDAAKAWKKITQTRGLEAQHMAYREMLGLPVK